MTTADSCPTKCSTTRTACHLRIATHVLVIPGQTSRVPSGTTQSACPNGFTRLRSWVRVPQRPPCSPWSEACGASPVTASNAGVRATCAIESWISASEGLRRARRGCRQPTGLRRWGSNRFASRWSSKTVCILPAASFALTNWLRRSSGSTVRLWSSNSASAGGAAKGFVGIPWAAFHSSMRSK